MHFSQLAEEELVLFLVLLVAVKHVYLKPYLNIQTQILLFMSDVGKEETKWQRYSRISLN
jgi:hypothetical protein